MWSKWIQILPAIGALALSLTLTNAAPDAKINL